MAGNSSITGDESIAFTDNMSFDGTKRGGRLNTNGQLWIGRTVGDRPLTNSGHVAKGVIASTTAALTVGYSDPNITLTVVPGSLLTSTLTPDINANGTAATPIAPNGGNINVQSSNTALTTTYNSNNAANGNLLIENRAWLTPLVVDGSTTIGTRGTFSTIAAAITAATSGQTIFIRSGLYNESLTLKAGVNLCSFDCNAETPNVTVQGGCVLNTAGTVTISGVRLVTNGPSFVTVSGANASILNLKNCYLLASNAAGITFSSSNASSQVNVEKCKGDISGATIRLFNHTSAGTLRFLYSNFTNSALSTTASTASAGGLACGYSSFNSPITTSGTNTFVAALSSFNCVLANTTALTIGGTNCTLTKCEIAGGTASAVSISTVAGLGDCIIQSTNASAVAGAGTLNYAGMIFSDTSSTITTTTQNVFNEGTRRSTMQPAFFMQSAGFTDGTGDGTAVTLTFGTTITNQGGFFGTTTFTAPYAGLYDFSFNIVLTDIGVAHTRGFLQLVTTARTLTIIDCNIGVIRSGINTCSFSGSQTVQMNAGATASLLLTVSGSTKTVDMAGTSYFACVAQT